MKKLFVILLALASLTSNAQCKLKKNEVDEFTKATKKITEETTLAKYKLWKLKSSLVKVNDSYFIYVFWGMSMADYPKLGCLTNNSYIMFKLANDEVITLRHQGDIDCGNTKSFYSAIDNDTVEKIKANPIVKMRYCREYSIDVEIRDKNVVGDMIRCTQI